MKPYTQTTNFTCASTSLLIVLNYFQNMELTKENEMKIWKETVNLPTRASSIYALANYAKSQGLNPLVIVGEKEYSYPDYRFNRYKKSDIEIATHFENIHYQQAKDNNVIIKEKKVKFNDLQEFLKENHLILRVNAKHLRNSKKNVSNYVLVNKIENGWVDLIDPRQGGITVTEETFKNSFETLNSKKYRDHKMILFKKKI
jgi:predicted double-glycine peptidase